MVAGLHGGGGTFADPRWQFRIFLEAVLVRIMAVLQYGGCFA